MTAKKNQSYRINLNRQIPTYRSFSVTYESFFQPIVQVVLCTVKNLFYSSLLVGKWFLYIEDANNRQELRKST
jgi:hypothetical protein